MKHRSSHPAASLDRPKRMPSNATESRSSKLKPCKPARYHPAVYQPYSSSAIDPTAPHETQNPLGPRPAHLRSYSEAQRQLLQRHRDLLLQSDSAYYSSPDCRPKTPDLAPLGSPGQIVTPLVLEETGNDFLQARSLGADASDQYQVTVRDASLGHPLPNTRHKSAPTSDSLPPAQTTR